MVAKLEVGLWTKAKLPGSHILDNLLQRSLETISSYMDCPRYLAGPVTTKMVKVALARASYDMPEHFPSDT